LFPGISGKIWVDPVCRSGQQEASKGTRFIGDTKKDREKQKKYIEALSVSGLFPLHIPRLHMQ